MGNYNTEVLTNNTLTADKLATPLAHFIGATNFSLALNC